MKKILLVAICFQCAFSNGFAQQNLTAADSLLDSFAGKKLTSEKQHELYLLGKVWGIIKYFHPAVAGGTINWDKELIDFLPSYLNASSEKERNYSLLSWVNKLGTVLPCTRCNDSLLQNAKLKPDFSWINAKNFGSELEKTLKFILANRQQGDQRYIKFQETDGLNITMYQNEDAYFRNQYPPASVRLIALYRFWNVIEYWYPYKYNLTTSWNDVLTEHIPSILASRNAVEYSLDIQKLVASIKDGHGNALSKTIEEMKGHYYAPFSVKYIEKKFIVTNMINDSLAAASGVKQGDIVLAINNSSVDTIIKKRLPFIAASNTGYAMYLLSGLITRDTTAVNNYSISRKGKIINLTVNYYFSKKWSEINEPFFSYQRDSAICMLKNKIAYLNLGKPLKNDSAAISNLIKSSKALIIDNRQNAIEEPGRENANMVISEIVSPGGWATAATSAQPAYPGVFNFLDSGFLRLQNNPQAYNKNIIILINEETMSVGEFMAMIFKTSPKAKLMGSNTAGADGAVTVLLLPGNIRVSFTWFGIYWPGGRETQRVGLAPDISFYPTIDGYQRQEDELLNNAIKYLSEKR